MAKKEETPEHIKKLKLPEHIEKFYDLHHKVDIMMNETSMSHSDAYNTAYNEILKDKGRDHAALDDEAIADEFADKIADTYIVRIKDRLGIKGETKNLDEEMLLNQYAGITRSGIKELVRNTGRKYVHDAHTNTMAKYIEESGLEGTLRNVANSKIKEEHIKGIVDYTGTEFLDPGKLRTQEAVQILKTFDKGKGAIKKGDYEKHIAYKKEAA